MAKNLSSHVESLRSFTKILDVWFYSVMKLFRRSLLLCLGDPNNDVVRCVFLIVHEFSLKGEFGGFPSVFNYKRVWASKPF